MAILNSTFGNIRGKVGGYIFKQINGKTIISARPNNVKIDLSPASVNRRNKFKMSSMFSSCLAKNPLLKKLWLDSENSGSRSAFQIISKHIYPYVSHNDISSNPRIAPGFAGLMFETDNISVKKDSLSVNINPVPESQQKYHPALELASHIKMAAFIKASDPFDNCLEPFRFFNLESEIVQYNPDNNTNISISYNDSFQIYLDDYFEHRFFIIFFALDFTGNLLSFSNTFDFVHKNQIT